MSTIHQFYCTHCTHGSAALERGEGEIAQRAFGYTARAASVEGEELRQYYRRIEPFLYYYLPRDTSEEQKLQLSAASAPRRLFFIPSAAGLQVAGQICYRPTDCEGRPGSYFSHILVQEEQHAPKRWTALDWLRLWGAPGWVQEDSAETPFLLPKLQSPADLLAGAAPAIDDQVLVSFLREPGDSAAFYDPAGILPERWRTMPPAERRQWFQEVLCRYLEAASANSQPVWVVVEPSVAALWFYGIARVLPDGPLRSRIAFSTFEADPERVKSGLAATWFHDPTTARYSDQIRLPGLVVNTLKEPSGARPRVAGKYAAAMIQRLADEGPGSVDQELALLGSVGVERVEELEPLAATRQIVSSVLETGLFPEEVRRGPPRVLQCVRLRLAQQLADMEDLGEGLKAVLNGPAYLTVMDLLTAKPRLRDVRRAVVHLLERIPPVRVLGLLRLTGVSDQDKVTVLLRHVRAHGKLPPGCDFMWKEFASAGEGAPHAGAVLLSRAIARMRPRDLKRLFKSAPQDEAAGVVLRLLRMHQRKRLTLASLSAVIQSLDETAVLALLRACGPEFLRGYPKQEVAMAEKLAELVRTLPSRPEQFKERLELILAGQHLLEERYHRAAEAWDTCYRKIQEVARLQRPDPNISPPMRMTLLVSACRELAMAADQALSADILDAEYPWTQKRDMLLRIAQEVLGGTPLLPPGPWEHEALLQRIGLQFQQHRWPMEPLRKEALAKKEPPRTLVGPEVKSLETTSGWLFVGVLVVVVAATAVLGWGIYKGFFAGSGKPATKQRPIRSKRGIDKRRPPQAHLIPRPMLHADPARSAGARLIAQAGQENLTAAILAGIRHRAACRQEKQTAQRPEVEDCRRIAILGA
ncbi:MAG: GAP1-N2 domain-containing protein [Thermoguttaceae bacterium]